MKNTVGHRNRVVRVNNSNTSSYPHIPDPDVRVVC